MSISKALHSVEIPTSFEFVLKEKRSIHPMVMHAFTDIQQTTLLQIYMPFARRPLANAIPYIMQSHDGWTMFLSSMHVLNCVL